MHLGSYHLLWTFGPCESHTCFVWDSHVYTSPSVSHILHVCVNGVQFIWNAKRVIELDIRHLWSEFSSGHSYRGSGLYLTTVLMSRSQWGRTHNAVYVDSTDIALRNHTFHPVYPFSCYWINTLMQSQGNCRHTNLKTNILMAVSCTNSGRIIFWSWKKKSLPCWCI